MEKICINGLEKLNIINNILDFHSKKREMILHYFRDGDLVDTVSCPTLLPEDYMELTKQKTLL